jgi:hypothetical protein
MHREAPAEVREEERRGGGGGTMMSRRMTRRESEELMWVASVPVWTWERSQESQGGGGEGAPTMALIISWANPNISTDWVTAEICWRVFWISWGDLPTEEVRNGGGGEEISPLPGVVFKEMEKAVLPPGESQDGRVENEFRGSDSVEWWIRFH